MNIAYFILLSLIFLIKIAFNVSAQPHPYFKFEGDTSLVKNKDCSCFDNTYIRIKSDINFKREDVVSSEFFWGLISQVLIIILFKNL